VSHLAYIQPFDFSFEVHVGGFDLTFDYASIEDFKRGHAIAAAAVRAINLTGLPANWDQLLADYHAARTEFSKCRAGSRAQVAAFERRHQAHGAIREAFCRESGAK
jgi:hypothetical protein